MQALSPSGGCPHQSHANLPEGGPAPHGELSPEDQGLVLNLLKEVDPPIAESCQR